MTFVTQTVMAATTAFLLAGSGPVTAAQTVFRCGSSYSQTPCAEGVKVDVDDSRSLQQQLAARDVAMREAALAAQMKSDRERAEAAAAVPAAKPVRTKATVATSTPGTGATARRKSKLRYSNDRDFVAFSPKPAKPSANQK